MPLLSIRFLVFSAIVYKSWLASKMICDLFVSLLAPEDATGGGTTVPDFAVWQAARSAWHFSSVFCNSASFAPPPPPSGRGQSDRRSRTARGSARHCPYRPERPCASCWPAGSLPAESLPATAGATVQVMVGPTPILDGEARSAGDITVVNEKLARQYWPNGNAIGQQIRRILLDQPDTLFGAARDFGILILDGLP